MTKLLICRYKGLINVNRTNFMYMYYQCKHLLLKFRCCCSMFLAPIVNQWLYLAFMVNVFLIVQICTDAGANRVKRVSCDNTTCLSGTCVHNSTSGETECECYPGYLKPRCTDRDECSMVQTLCHNGTCQNTPGSFQCRCNDGYTGKRCTEDVDECKSSPCLNNNTCVNTLGSYHCACYAGYNPPDCRDRDECAIATGLCHNGTCINTLGSFHCNCHYGYAGEHCTDKDPCITAPCKNGGTCLPSHHSRNYTCQCYAGFNRSSDCTDINECDLSSELCFHGNCQNTQGSYKCACSPGYTGSHCRDQIDYCKSSPCEMGGTCIQQQNGYTCNCSAGFNDSANCMDIDECGMNLANCHHGSCINLMGTYQCFCNAGYQGDRCTEDKDECKSNTNPCPDNTCINTPGSYFCGTDYCITRPCIYGYCRPTVDSYVCECDEGFTGDDCEEPVSSTVRSTLSSSSKLTPSHRYTTPSTSTKLATSASTNEIITETKSTQLRTASPSDTTFSTVSRKVLTSLLTSKVTKNTSSTKTIIPTKITKETHHTSPSKATTVASTSKIAISSNSVSVGRSTSSVKYQTESQHSTISTQPKTSMTSFVTTPQPTNNAASDKSIKSQSDKPWVSGHYWIFIIIATIVIACGAGVLVLGFKKRKQMIMYNKFGNGSTPSSPGSPANFYRDNPLYDQINNLTKEGDAPHVEIHTGTFIENRLYQETDTDDLTSTSTLGNKDKVGMNKTRSDSAEIKIDFYRSSCNTVDDGNRHIYCSYDAGTSET